MNYFVCLAMMALMVAVATANPANQHLDAESKPLQIDSQSGDYTRVRKSANYGIPTPPTPPGIPPLPVILPPHPGIYAPPCPNNYLFSCQPSLAPVPCSGGSGHYPPPGPPYPPPGPPYPPQGGYPLGAHSTYVPTYIAPYGNNYAVREAYNGYAPQAYQQY